MRKPGLILLGGLVVVSLSHRYSSEAHERHTCVANSHYHTTCPVTSEFANYAAADASLEPTDLSEPAPEQNTALSGRLLQLIDTFAELVMVI